VVGLFEPALIRAPERHESVLFEYDYHPVKRWLFKLRFNLARVHDAGDLFAFQPLRSSAWESY